MQDMQCHLQEMLQSSRSYRMSHALLPWLTDRLTRKNLTANQARCIVTGCNRIAQRSKGSGLCTFATVLAASLSMPAWSMKMPKASTASGNSALAAVYAAKAIAVLTSAEFA